jgi:hypothetical protein
MGVGVGFDLPPEQPLSLGSGVSFRCGVGSVKPAPVGTRCHP